MVLTPRKGKPRVENASAYPIPSSEISKVRVTPEMAAGWLLHNNQNRRLEPYTVEMLAEEMKSGEFLFNGDTIRFLEPDENGVVEMFDGQKRLAAIVASGEPQWMIVVTGLTRPAKHTVDIGQKRNVVHSLTMEGHANAAILAGLARMGLLQDKADREGRTMATFKANIRGSADLAVRKWIAENPDAQTHANFAGNMQRVGIPPTSTAFVSWRLSRFNDHRSRTMLLDLGMLKAGGKGDPMSALLRCLISETGQRGRKSVTRDEGVSLLFRTWNHIVRQQRVKGIGTTDMKGKVIPIPEPLDPRAVEVQQA